MTIQLCDCVTPFSYYYYSAFDVGGRTISTSLSDDVKKMRAHKGLVPAGSARACPERCVRFSALSPVRRKCVKISHKIVNLATL